MRHSFSLSLSLSVSLCPAGPQLQFWFISVGVNQAQPALPTGAIAAKQYTQLVLYWFHFYLKTLAWPSSGEWRGRRPTVAPAALISANWELHVKSERAEGARLLCSTL
uniref:Putative secreted protein n=1 Tax=Anopheles triannulatus TaxID=58253 RepID=A0A2M4B1X8_9DIPT